jgi:hexosaminidase
MTTGDSPLQLVPGFNIKIAGIHNIPQDLSDAVHRTTNYLKTDKLGALVPDRGASSAHTVHSARVLSSLTLSLAGSQSFGQALVKGISEDAIAGLGIADESYTLDIPASGGDAKLTANSALGLYRGLTTFEQLWFYVNGTTYTLQAPIHIQDAPAYVSGFCVPFGLGLR